uniref:Uncharacterized protein n=1 Tax=Salarias fasciatus TaxID=181472 RepID=A0A672HA75_SALFA
TTHHSAFGSVLPDAMCLLHAAAAAPPPKRSSGKSSGMHAARGREGVKRGGRWMMRWLGVCAPPGFISPSRTPLSLSPVCSLSLSSGAPTARRDWSGPGN